MHGHKIENMVVIYLHHLLSTWIVLYERKLAFFMGFNAVIVT